ncbi:MAG TPA: lipid-binding SYLF domain-containing protein [Pirellulales bacterium]|nr:lipid-binding SYLF domain-containing protein [Pirellulales bacterium]
MNKRSRLLVVGTLAWMLNSGQPLRADCRERVILEKANAVLVELEARYCNRLALAALRNTEGVAAFPGTIKAAALVGGRRGRGVLMVREEDGSWGPPLFLTLSGASFGNQLGLEATDMVFMLRTRSSLESLKKGRLTLGAGVTLAVGPLGQDKGLGTDVCLKTGFVYASHSRGLFAGVYAEGACLSMDAPATAAYQQWEQAYWQSVRRTGREAPPSLRLQMKLAQLSATPPTLETMSP